VFISGSNLLECLNPTEEPLNGTALLVEFRIKPEWPPSFRMSPGSPVRRDIALDPSFSVVLPNLPGSVGCICGDDRGVILYLRNLKYFEGWFVKLGIMVICRGKQYRQAGGCPDRPEHSVYSCSPSCSHHSWSILVHRPKHRMSLINPQGHAAVGRYAAPSKESSSG